MTNDDKNKRRVFMNKKVCFLCGGQATSIYRQGYWYDGKTFCSVLCRDRYQSLVEDNKDVGNQSD